jgi:hypothetical protein
MKIFAGAALCLVLTLPAAAQDKPAATGANDPSDKEVLEPKAAIQMRAGKPLSPVSSMRARKSRRASIVSWIRN